MLSAQLEESISNRVGDSVLASNRKKKDLFGFLFAISFILNGYASGIPGISLGSLAFVCLIAWAFLSKSKTKKDSLTAPFLKFVVLFLIISLFSFIFAEYKSFSGLFTGLLKILTWFFMITTVSNNFYSSKQMTKWFTRIGIILTIYLFIQTFFFYVFHIYLPNIFNFGFLKPYDEEYANYGVLGSGSIVRAASFFSESSFYGNYMLCSLLLFLGQNYKKMTKKNWFIVLFISAGIIVSTSTAAIIFLVIIWLFYIWKIKVKKFFLFSFLIIVALIAVPIFLSGTLDFDNGFMSSLKYAFDKFDYIDNSSRFGKSFAYLSLLNQKQFLFGIGLGNDLFFINSNVFGVDSVYINAVTSVIFQAGIIGMSLFTLLIIINIFKSIKYRDLVSFLLFGIYFVKGFESTVFFSTYGILFLFIAMGRLYEKKNSLFYKGAYL